MITNERSVASRVASAICKVGEMIEWIITPNNRAKPPSSKDAQTRLILLCLKTEILVDYNFLMNFRRRIDELTRLMSTINVDMPVATDSLVQMDV